jgi:hypothetical protein
MPRVRPGAPAGYGPGRFSNRSCGIRAMPSLPSGAAGRSPCGPPLPPPLVGKRLAMGKSMVVSDAEARSSFMGVDAGMKTSDLVCRLSKDVTAIGTRLALILLRSPTTENRNAQRAPRTDCRFTKKGARCRERISPQNGSIILIFHGFRSSTRIFKKLLDKQPVYDQNEWSDRLKRLPP